MTPGELAALHPKLFHVTVPENLPGIRARGLLTAARLVDLFDVSPAARAAIVARPRPARVTLRHATYGTAIINDNTPLSEAALARCLDDGLAPLDWMAMLNTRVFFWAQADEVPTLTGARLNRRRRLAVLEIDTLGLARAHADRVEISPINSGSTIRRPARRGHATFRPLAAVAARPKPRVREVVVRDGVVPLAPHLLAVHEVTGG
jgi:hypothetical protein